MSKAIQLLNKAKRLLSFSDDYGSRIAGDKSGKVISKEVSKVFGLDDVTAIENDIASNPQNRELWAKVRKSLDPLFGTTVEENIPYAGRVTAGIKSNIQVFSDTYYKAKQMIAKGTLKLSEAGDYARNENIKLIKNSFFNYLKTELSPTLSELYRKGGISKTTYDVVLKYAKVGENALKNGDIRAYNKAMNQIQEQLHGHFLHAFQSGTKGPIRELQDIFIKQSKLPKNAVDDIVSLQRLDKIPQGIMPVVVTQKGGKFLNDMFHNDALGVLSYIIASAKRNGLSMTKLKNQIEKELKHVTLKSLKRNSDLKSWAPEEIEKYYGRFGFHPKVERTKDGLKITNVIMSSDYTAGYAPVTTYVDKNYNTVKRFMHDIYDGGTIGGFDFKKGFSYNMSIAQNRLWNYKNQNILVQSTNLQNVHHIDSPVTALKYSAMWRKIKQRTGFKKTVDQLSDLLNQPKDLIEDEILLRINRYVQLDTASGKIGPMASLDKIMSKFLSNHSKQKELDKTIKEFIADPKLAQSIIGDNADSALLAAQRRIKRAKDLVPKGDVKPKKLNKKVQAIIDLITEAENRGMTGDEAMQWAFRNVAKAGIGAGTAGIIIEQLFSED
tara:strand:- start:4406 stop:6232 length:1827 start_codon:yes stop_codon:yes gene_type:complete